MKRDITLFFALLYVLVPSPGAKSIELVRVGEEFQVSSESTGNNLKPSIAGNQRRALGDLGGAGLLRVRCIALLGLADDSS